MRKPKNWIAVASADHVVRGVEQGFIQVCHGKLAPLRRIQAGDRVVMYSPTHCYEGSSQRSNRLQSFTAIATVIGGQAYQVSMSVDFFPFRRDVVWHTSRVASILPLLSQLDMTRGRQNWGYAFRFGLIEISTHDMDCIAQAMSAQLIDHSKLAPVSPLLVGMQQRLLFDRLETS